MNESRNKEILNFVSNLIKTRSYSGEETGVSNLLSAYFKNHHFDDIIIDDYGNTIGIIKGKRPGPHVLFDGHMDTVPVTDPSVWKHPPFSAEVSDGKIYGRGTSDMKGALGTMCCAASFFGDDTNRDCNGEIYIAGVVHEECFEGIAARSISQIVKPDYVIIGEASDLNLKIGQRGRGEICLETFGIPAHSSNPDKGVNAVYSMCRAVSLIQKLVPPEHPFLGKGILELTDIKSSPYPGASVVPEYCRATYDRRLLVGETRESVLKPIQDILDRLSSEDTNFRAKVSFSKGSEKCCTGAEISGERFFPGWCFDKNESYIQKILSSLHSMGYNPKITRYNFCTNGSHYAGEAGIPTVGMGPSRENLAHTIDEYCELDQLYKVTDCYYAIMNALLKNK